MSSIKRAVAAGFALVVMTSSAFAQVSASFADFGKGPAQFIMTPDEAKQWKNVKTDEQAKAFIDLFWAKRDPSPATLDVNEYRQEFENRVKTADVNFTNAKKAGSLTEPGRFMIVLGPPTRIVRSSNQPSSTVQRQDNDLTGASTLQAYSPKQVWYYDKGKAEFETGAPIVEVAFIDQYNTGDWTLERTGRTDTKSLVNRVINESIKQPGLKEAPKAAAAVPAPVAAPVAPATTAAGAIKTESLRTAISEFKAAAGKGPYKNAAITFTELVSPTGEAFVPVQLYIPKSAELTATAVTTFFGVVEDANGASVLTFEEPATLSTSGGDLYFDKALTLAPGKYVATLGLAGADGKPVVLSTSPMEVRDYNKTSTGVSRLVLARDLHETETAAPAGAPYAFGRLKIVPKGDSVFTNKDEINYFFEVFNPTIEEATQLPKLQIKLELTGKVKQKDGKPYSITAPLSDASPLPLSGSTGPGQYAIIGSIPLGAMKNSPPPGEYTLKVSLYDQGVKPAAVHKIEQNITLVAGEAAPAAAAPAK